MNVVRGTRVCIHSVRTSVVTTHMSACTCRYLLVVRTTDRKGAPEPHAAVCQTGRRNGRKEGRKEGSQAGRQASREAGRGTKEVPIQLLSPPNGTGATSGRVMLARRRALLRLYVPRCGPKDYKSTKLLEKTEASGGITEYFVVRARKQPTEKFLGNGRTKRSNITHLGTPKSRRSTSTCIFQRENKFKSSARPRLFLFQKRINPRFIKTVS